MEVVKQVIKAAQEKLEADRQKQKGKILVCLFELFHRKWHSMGSLNSKSCYEHLTK